MGTQSKLRKKEDLDGALATIEKIFRSGTMEKDVYHKCLVSLGYEYILADEQQTGLVLISRPPTSYFQDVLYRQMKEDQMYAELVVLLSYKLVQMGVVDGSEKLYTPTMPVAEA